MEKVNSIKVQNELNRWFRNGTWLDEKVKDWSINQVILNRGIMGHSHGMGMWVALGNQAEWNMWMKKHTRNEIGENKQILRNLLKQKVLSKKEFDKKIRYCNDYFKVEPLSQQEMCYEY